MTENRVFRVRIAASPELTWAAITSPARTKRWYFDSEIRTTWEVGSPVDYVRGDALQITGRTWEVEPDGDGCTVTLLHTGAYGQETADGSQHIVDALKAYLEAEPQRRA
ncbi:SRPBCC domain-containing protein [Galbitalea sp. SE-J8]|uniref:SRPBCC domain-containing protein n=1 Tax=Galbitalea sp. SE-J8 TaxID=3054952 RepID=UPI00259CCAE8|nr:SRPBCC domain-containing protein [Galbitalea sp. SE-J8]MDM4762574.1 SRPBCC domain-containing protein [Galbitalea sp. SE-J8]